MSNYKAPGVNVSEVQDVNSGNVQSVPRRMCIAGKASDTILIENLDVVKGNAGGTDTITGTTAADVSSVVGVGSVPGLYDYLLNTDYTVSNNTIVWAGAVNQPDTGSTYYVTYYQNKGASYYEPVTEVRIDDVRTVFGAELSNGVINEIALGARLCFMNGAGEILAVQQNGTTTQDEEDAIDKLQKQSLDIIVAPGMCSTTLQQYIFAHCKLMSSDTIKKDRIYFTTHQYTDASVDDIIALAQSFDNDIVTVIAPPTIDITLTDAVCQTDVLCNVSSAYAGAALAGIISNPDNDEAQPLTRQQLLGIDSLGTSYTDIEMNRMAANGVLVLENVNGIIRVRHALTTQVGNVNNAELEIKVLRNQTRKDLRTLFEQFIGTKYDRNTNTKLAGALKGFCDQKVRDGVYYTYDESSISVVQSSLDPRRADVSYRFKPVYTLTYIDIKYALYF